MMAASSSWLTSFILNLDVIRDSTLWDERVITRAGKGFVRNFSFAKFVGALSDEEVLCPMLVNNSACAYKRNYKHPEDLGWRIENMRTFVGSDWVAIPFFDYSDMFHHIFNVTLYTLIGIIFFFFVIHFVLLRISHEFPKLDASQALITTTHMAFFILYICQVGPYTYYTLRIIFGPRIVQTFYDHFEFLFWCIVSKGMMYVVEGCSRSVIRVNTFLVFHHIMWGIFVVVASTQKSIFAIKLAFVLDILAVWEVPLYLFLVLKRLKAPLILVDTCAFFGLSLFGITRIAQLIFIIAFFVMGAERMLHEDPSTWGAELALSTILVVLQTYLFVIYAGIIRRMHAKKPSAPKEPEHELADPASVTISLEAAKLEVTRMNEGEAVVAWEGKHIDFMGLSEHIGSA
ncbi:hypothetical protein DUNSADRAFT_23 [Dunaliella salina]|uniref:TLC domain-containing protein n=1 Tax=Dunaliella salina TaxID=3046 RepID=A0ABQ7HAM2_DUNSA|nr:hypothetical protein DUNSADRAFT_23 [Dunaliella salina]|eukprot:KAF5843901.1 hypothetical protein DUNSADRAFT_23 [Dunaliella salina]